MNLTRVAVAVGLAWVAASLLLKGRRAAPVEGDDGLAALPSVDTGLPVRVRALTVPGRSLRTRGGAAGFASGE